MTNVGPDHSILAKSLLEVKANIQYYISITKTFYYQFQSGTIGENTYPVLRQQALRHPHQLLG